MYTLDIAPLRESSSQKRSGMARVLKGSQFYLHTKGALKMQDRKMQDLKMQDQIAGHENAGPENAGPNCRA